MTIANPLEVIQQGVIDFPFDWDPIPDPERLWKYLIIAAKWRLRLPIGMFLHKIWAIWVTDGFKRGDGISGMMIAQCGHETWRQRV